MITAVALSPHPTLMLASFTTAPPSSPCSPATRPSHIDPARRPCRSPDRIVNLERAVAIDDRLGPPCWCDASLWRRHRVITSGDAVSAMIPGQDQTLATQPATTDNSMTTTSCSSTVSLPGRPVLTRVALSTFTFAAPVAHQVVLRPSILNSPPTRSGPPSVVSGVQPVLAAR